MSVPVKLPEEAVILAGGLGTRLRESVPDLPKPMAPVGGRPFLEYLLDYWIGQGIGSFVVSVGYMHENITRHFGQSYRGASIRYAVEETPLGTGGGLALAVSLLNSHAPFLVVNGDTFFEVPLARMAAFHHRVRSEWTIALFQSNGHSARYGGIQTDQGGKITSLGNAHQSQGATLLNGGVYLLNRSTPEALDIMPGEHASLEDDYFPRLLTKGIPFYGYECVGRFIDIGIPDDYRRAEDIFSQHEAGIRNEGQGN